MSIDPALLEIFAAAGAGEGVPALSAGIDAVRAARARIDAGGDELGLKTTEPGPEVGSFDDVEIPVEGATISARIYLPEGDGPFPAHVYFHGGSWSQGSYTSVYFDATCRERCALGLVVLSVDYRLAPEHPFPTPLEDCFTALRWLVDQAGDLRIDTDSVSIGGGSAGGNLAAAATLLAKQRGGPTLCAAILEVPALDLTGAHLDLTVPGAELMGDLKEIFGGYIGDADPTNPLLSPLFSDELSTFPPTVVMTAEFDPLRGDGEAFADKLRTHGVEVTSSRGAGHLHPTPGFTKVFPPAVLWRDELLASLRRAHGL